MKQCRFAASGRADERDKLAFPYMEINVGEHQPWRLLVREALRYRFHFERNRLSVTLLYPWLCREPIIVPPS